MTGPPRRRRSGHVAFVSLCRFLALISANVRLRFLWDSPGLSGPRSWRCILRAFMPAGEGIRLEKGLQRRHLAAVKTQRDARSRSETLNGGSRWLLTLTSIYQKPVYSGWQDRAAEESTSPGKMDAARSTAVRKAWQLWPEAIPADLEGNWCCTEVAIWYEVLVVNHEIPFVSTLGGQTGGKLPLNQFFYFN